MKPRFFTKRFSMMLPMGIANHVSEEGGYSVSQKEVVTMTLEELDRLQRRSKELYNAAITLNRIANDASEGHISKMARQAVRDARNVIKETRG